MPWFFFGSLIYDFVWMFLINFVPDLTNVTNLPKKEKKIEGEREREREGEFFYPRILSSTVYF